MVILHDCQTNRVMERKSEIDVGTMSEQEIYKHLMHKMYGDEIPFDAYEFPAGAILTPADEFNSDYHIDLGHFEYDNDVSNYPFYCPPVLGQVQEQKRNRKTFQHKDMFMDKGTYFEDALKSFLELVVILKSYGKGTKNLNKWFKREWGLKDELDLERLIPSVLGEGDNRFATLDKIAEPNVLYNAENTAVITVKSHSVKREDFGPDAHLDWARVQAILLNIGNLLLVEGFEKNRFDFNIVAENVPKYKDEFEWDDDAIEVPEGSVVSEYYSDVVSALLKRLELYSQEVLSDENIFVSNDDKVKVDERELLRLDSLVIARTELEMVDIMEYMDKEDILDVPKVRKPEVKIDRVDDNKKSYNRYKHLCSIVRRIGKFDELTDLDYIKITRQVNSGKIDDNVVKAVFNGLVLNAVVVHEKTMFEKESDVFGSIVDYWKLLGLPKDAWKTSDLKLLVKLYSGHKDVRVACAEIVRDVIAGVHGDRVRVGTLDKHVYSYMRKHNDLWGGLSRYVKARKRYWSKHYYKKSVNSVKIPDKIENQHFCTIFKHLRVTMSGGIMINDKDLNADFYKMAVRFIEKRQTKNKDKVGAGEFSLKVAQIPKQDSIPSVEYARKLDIVMGWDIKLATSLKKAIIKGKKLGEDVKHVFETVTDEKEEYFLDMELELDHDNIPAKEVSPRVIEEVKPTVDAWGDLDDDEEEEIFEEEDEPKVMMISIYELVHSKHHFNTDKIVAQLESMYGKSVPYKDREGVLKLAKELDLKWVNNPNIVALVDRVEDIVDV